MKIIFVYLGSENLGIEYISSVLKKNGHQVDLAFDPGLFDDKVFIRVPFLRNMMRFENRLLEKIEASKPDLVGFSTITANYQWACRIAKRVKDILGLPILFGGIHATSVPERVIGNSFVDMVCIGEGEYPVLELMNSMGKGKANYSIKNLWFKKDGEIIKNPVRELIDDLDSLGFPDKSLFAKDVIIGDDYRIMASRGCPFYCAFCCNSILKHLYHKKGRYVRRRSIDNVIEELRLAKQKYKIRHIVFHDDIFTLSKSWLEGFLARYRQAIGLSFRCNIHAKFFDYEIATWLKESNCDRVILGIESINESIRRNILQRHETNEEMEEALRICDEVGLPYHLQHIVGLPFESENDLVDAVTFYLRNKKLKRIATFYLSYFPKTRLTQFAGERGLLSNGELLDIEEGKMPIYHHGGSIKSKEVLKRCKRFVILFLFIPLFPKILIKYVIERRIYKYFHLIPPCFLYIFTLLLYFKSRDMRLVSYPKYYFHHLKSLLKE